MAMSAKGDAMGQFRKRTYKSLSGFLRDLRFLFANRRRIRHVMREKSIDPRMRERLMLAVTQVNECRFCSRFHSRLALTEGMSPDEIGALLQGETGACPSAELTALLYAQHWADVEGDTGLDARNRLVAVYGQSVADDIELVLRVIKAGNYTGNTVDCLLHRVSGGRWGG
jgi:AhpD family alkylhydroperoxidase